MVILHASVARELKQPVAKDAFVAVRKMLLIKAETSSLGVDELSTFAQVSLVGGSFIRPTVNLCAFAVTHLVKSFKSHYQASR